MRSNTSAGRQPTSVPADRMKLWLHWGLAVLLAATLMLVLATEGLQLTLPGNPGWPEALLLLLATAGTFSALARQLPLQNVLLAGLVIALIGGATHTLGVSQGIPFGPFMFGPAAGPQLFKLLPWGLPLLWVAVILNSRGVARLILRPWRKVRNYGFWLIGLTALLTAGFDLALDPYATRAKHYWLWQPTKFPVTWQGAPLVNFFSWATVALLMLAFVTPALINKNPVRHPPDYHPLAVWLGGLLLFGLTSALHGMWPAAVVDGALAVLAATFAIRGGRW